MKSLIFPLWALGALVAGCASAPPAPDHNLFADSLFGPRPQLVSREEIFALSAPMQDFIATRMHASHPFAGPRTSLFEALQGELKLEFDSSQTRTAAQAFEARSGNCLSLVILTAAFARALEIPVVYQSVFGHDTWSRSAGLAVLSGHVNVVIGQRRPASVLTKEMERTMTVDFLPPETGSALHTSAVPEDTVVAMYMNNRAAESLVQGDTDAAYWWARDAIGTAPAFLNSYNTLGVVYLRHGRLAEAERALRFALQREPGNARVLSNLARVLTDQGRLPEAQRTRERLAQIAEFPPFHFFDLGMAAMDAGENGRALVLFKKELARMPYDHELHFAAAVANLRMGEKRVARRHLSLALENSTTRDSRGIYAAKLDHLRSLGVY